VNLTGAIVSADLGAATEAGGMCPDADGNAGDPAGVECEVIPGCNYPNNGTLTPLSLQCSNELSDVDCDALFPCKDGNPAPAANCNQQTFGTITNDDPKTYPMVRAAACTSPNLRNIALQCAKTCALCCETPEFNCDDDSKSPVNCAANTAKCKDPSWADIMSQYCPKTCGLCDSGTCSDLNSGCNTVASLCKNVDFIDYMRTNCARTCDYCTSSSNTCRDIATNCAQNANLCTNATYRTLMQQQCCGTCSTASSSPAVSCTDADSNCASWVRNGFCSNSFYTAAQKRQYCARSCNLC